MQPIIVSLMFTCTCTCTCRLYMKMLVYLLSDAQCDQLEEELTSLLQRRRMVMNAALEALSQYRTITAQFPAEYLKQSRSYLWEQCLHDISTLDETLQHERS